jgi:hypothetical protein
MEYSIFHFCLYFGWSWFELVALRFSRTQLGTHLGYFEGFLRVLGRRSNLRKSLSDEGLELVPGGGIEPSTHGFSVSAPEFHNFLEFNKLLEQWIF